MSWITAITALFGSINPLIAIGGTAVSALLGYFVNQWLSKQAAKKAASDQMDSDMQSHSGDGSISVGDESSAEDQIAKLKQEAAQMDNPPKGSKP